MDKRLLDILCCPETRQALRLAQPAELDRVNRALARREVPDASGKISVDPIEALLVREDGKKGYAVRKGIPDLLKDDALVLESIGSPSFAFAGGAES